LGWESIKKKKKRKKRVERSQHMKRGLLTEKKKGRAEEEK